MKNNLKRLNDLITNHGFALQSWEDRYSKGVWVCISPDAKLLCEVYYLTDGEIDQLPCTDFFSGVEWIPFVVGKDFMSGLKELETILLTIPEELLCQNSLWSNAVYEALSDLKEVKRASTSYGGTEGKFKQLPVTLEKLIQTSGK